MIKISTRQRLLRRIFLFMLAGFFTFSAVAEPLISDQQKSSYALGVDYMTGLQRDAMLLDNQAFLQGITDIQSGKGSKLNAQQTRRALDYFIAERFKHRQDQVFETRLRGENFMQQNRNKSDVKELSSGLQYSVLHVGNAQTHPTEDGGVAVRYRLFDLDGNELLSSFSQGDEPKKLAVNQLIAGWRQALPLMTPGDKWRLFLAPDLAYGEEGSPDGKIKPSQTLIYELELVAIVPLTEAIAEMDKPQVVGGKPNSFQSE